MVKGLVVIALLAMLSGCVTVSNNKHLTIAPSKEPVLVTANAQAKCYDVFFIMFCKMNMSMDASNGQRVSDFAR